MRFSFSNIAFVSAFALQACSLQMRWPAVVHVNDVVVLQFSDGIPPYLIGVIQYPKKVLVATERQTAGNYSWVCTVPRGEQIAFMLFDGLNNTVDSGWTTVLEDPAVTSSLISVSSISASIAIESSMSALSTSLAGAQHTPTPTPTPESQQTPVGPIVGGVVGGAAGLLILVLVAFWFIRQSRPESQPHVLPTAAPAPGWHPGMEKNAATLALPTTTSGVYSGLPEVQNPRY